MKDEMTALKCIIANIEKVLIGKRQVIELALVALMCRGHILIEDVPGVGKTSLAAALARSLSCSFQRIQFTPDIMPSDITGFSLYNPKTNEFEYRKGAVLNQVVLADEINRTSPKTQSSLLEAMEERQVTADGNTYKIEEPFIVMATQNPVEYLGTYPLPEAQMDRFFMKLSLGYPEKAEEMRMTSMFRDGNPLAALGPVASGADILGIQAKVTGVHVDAKVNEYIVNLVRATREHEYVVLGASPRGSLNLYKASQAWALYNGRGYALPDDAVYMAPHILRHRLVLRQEGRFKNIEPADIIEDIIRKTAVPVL